MVIQEANSGLVQKVQPNDKSGKLLPNDHTKGAQESTGTPYVEGLREIVVTNGRGMRALNAYSAFGVAGGSNRLSAAGRGSSQMRLSSETKSMDFFVEGRGRSSAFLRPLPSFSTVEGMSGRLLAAVRPFSSICLCRTFSTALLQAL